MWSAHELIVAPATVPGPGARAVVRLAGDGLDTLLATLFVAGEAGFPRHGQPPRLVPVRLAAGGLGRDWGELQVDVLAWPGPGGPIGGPLAEVQLPASESLVAAVIAAACRAGARVARGGEFTLRAFLAGRVDLVQAESVLAVVDARTPEELSVALDRMAGGAGRALAGVRDELLDLLADIEAAIDFADETIPDAVPAAPAWPAVVRRLGRCAASIEKVAGHLARRDATAADLPRVVLVGRPNIGKSSLFNALAGTDAALVADESGTTRDWLEARLGGGTGGPPFVLVDLAGLDEPDATDTAGGPDDVGAAARERAAAEATRADVVVACRDARDGGEPTGWAADVPRIDVLTRCDRGSSAESACRAIATSSQFGTGIESLRAAIRDALSLLPGRGAAATVRMAVGADAARAAIEEARAGASAAAGGAAIDESLVAASIRRAVESLADITGAAIGSDLIERIFSRHCIGK